MNRTFGSISPELLDFIFYFIFLKEKKSTMTSQQVLIIVGFGSEWTDDFQGKIELSLNRFTIKG